MGDWHTHVYTSTYTSDVSGVCSVMYELGGMSVLHDPSGCNSTYTTHDEPRWYASNSLMFISGLDEMSAVFGDDQKLIDSVIDAYQKIHPRFITLCGASIPHIIGFDYKGVAKQIESQTGIIVLPIETDGLQSYISGIGKASKAWMERFVSYKEKKDCINLLGITPIDFGNEKQVLEIKQNLNETINCCFAYQDNFENLTNIAQASVNLLPTSAGRICAKYLKKKYKIPYVEGIPIGPYMKEQVQTCIQLAKKNMENMIAYEENDLGEILVIGEEIYAKSLASEITHTYDIPAYAYYPDINEGLNEDDLIEKSEQAQFVVCDPLFQTVIDPNKIIPVPHIGYSGRIYLNQIPTYQEILEMIERKIKNEII